MKLRALLALLGLTLIVLILLLWQSSPGKRTLPILSFSIGQTFDEVVNASSFAVLEHSNIPASGGVQAGETFVTEPSVILQFNDPKHGFRMAPTKFAMIGYTHNRVETVATSPMLEKMPFDQAVAILDDLQKQFKAGGWEPWPGDGSVWFDLSHDGKKRLHARLFQPGFSHEATLRVPHKYGMVFRIWCADGCMTGRPPFLFLIDIGIGNDLYAGIPPNVPPMQPRSY